MGMETGTTDDQYLVQRRQGTFVLLLALTIFSLSFLVLTFRIPLINDDAFSWPGMMPAVSLIAILVLVAVVVFRYYVKHPDLMDIAILKRRIPGVIRRSKEFRRGVSVFAYLFVYIYLMLPLLQKVLPRPFTYLVSTFLFQFFLLLNLAKTRMVTALIVASVSTGTLYVMFGVLYRLPLP